MQLKPSKKVRLLRMTSYLRTDSVVAVKSGPKWTMESKRTVNPESGHQV